MCYNLFPRRPEKAGAEIDNDCCRARLDTEHVGSCYNTVYDWCRDIRAISLNQWVKDKQLKRCIRLEVCKLSRRARRIPCKVAS